MSTDTLASRMLLLIQKTTREHRRYKELEEQTMVPADRWKAFALGRQRPTAEMIETLARKWPEHALWLTTGIDDSEFGQTAPNDEAPTTRSPTGKMLSRKIELKSRIHLSSTWIALEGARLDKRDPHPQTPADAAESLFQTMKLAELYGLNFEPSDPEFRKKLEDLAVEKDQELQMYRALRLRESMAHGNQEG